MSAASDAKSAADLANDPDMLYAKAIGALHLNPAIVSALSPAAKSLYDVAYSVVKGAIGDGISQIGQEAMGLAVEALGPELVSQIAGIAEQLGIAVADAVPIVNIMMAVANIVTAVRDAANAPLVQRVNDFYTVGIVQGTGYDHTITGADLFAPSTEARADNPMWNHYTDRPRSTLGAVLAAITEDNETEAPLAAYPTDPGPFRWPGTDPMRAQALDADTNLHHSGIIWDLASNATWPGKDHSASTDFSGPADPNARIGIPKSRRMVYQALRRAMGARGSDQGATLLPIYLDMIADDFANGALTSYFINQLLSWVYTDSGDLGPAAFGLEEVAGVDNRAIIDRPGAIGFTRAQRDELTTMAVQFVQSWIAKRDAIGAKIAPHLLKAHASIHLGPMMGDTKGAKKGGAKAGGAAAKGGGGAGPVLILGALALMALRGRR